MALQIYLPAHPKYEMKRGGFPVSRPFADRIQSDIQDVLGRVDGVSVNQIVEALKAIRSRSLSR